mmetsp:Transcript_33054/g.79966  ORF Transcript_33054/g.79966 Transcript_33054/m.79966 type:complete len:407 (+) Transcript_33054:115-1335(+)
MVRPFILSLAVAFGSGALSSFASGQNSVDIGTVGIAGHSTQTAVGWDVYGTGSDIWGSNDSFHYLNLPKTGDVTVTLLAKSFATTTTNGNTHEWAKAGVMIRDSLDASAPYAMMTLTGRGRLAHQSRVDPGIGTDSHHDWDVTHSGKEVWLRLVKEGSRITSYVKDVEDFGFRMFHYTTVNFSEDDGGEFYVGIAVSSQDNSHEARFETSDLEILDEAVHTDGMIVDIGETGRAAMAREVAQNVFEIQGAGKDIGGTHDDFAFYAAPASGDITATLLLSTLSRRTKDTKGGLMMRASHATDAPHVSLLVQSSTGVTLMYRAAPGGNTVSKNVGVHEGDVELRLAKDGNSVACLYRQVGAAEWFHIDTVEVEMGTNFQVGQAVASGDFNNESTMTTDTLQVVPTATA